MSPPDERGTSLALVAELEAFQARQAELPTWDQSAGANASLTQPAEKWALPSSQEVGLEASPFLADELGPWLALAVEQVAW